MTLRYDELIEIDGEHTIQTTLIAGRLTNETVPVSGIYRWSAEESAPAWPLHEERGLTAAGAPIAEHETLPVLDPEVVRRMHWTPSHYEQAVQTLLDQVLRTGSGRRLRHEMTMPVTIMPFVLRDPTVDGTTFRPNAAPRATRSRDIFIIFTPGHFPPRFRGSSLFHELVHVYRIMSGNYRPSEEIYNPARYTVWEEWPAVCIENIFRSETGLPLRWGHFDLSMELIDPDRWAADPRNRVLIERLWREMPALSQALAELEVQFNPFRLSMRSEAEDTPPRAVRHASGPIYPRTPGPIGVDPV